MSDTAAVGRAESVRSSPLGIVAVGLVMGLVNALLTVALLSLVFVGPKTLWGLIGIVPIITGLSRRCPAYSPFGISTCSRK